MPNSHFASLNAYHPGKTAAQIKALYGIDELVKLSSNENVLGPAPETIAAMQAACTRVHEYPDQIAKTCDDIAAIHNLSPNTIVLGNGSDEIFQLLGQTFLKPGDEVLSSEQTFSQYKFIATVAQATYKEIPLVDTTYDLMALKAAITNKTRIVFIANPNNPTGTRVSNAALESFIKVVPATCLVVIDEAYAEYVTDEVLSFDLAKRYPNVMITRTFSKLYAIAGTRIGFGVTHKDIVANLHRVAQPFHINSVAMAGAQAALKASSHIRQSLELNEAGKAYYKANFNCDTQGNFVMIDLSIRADDVFEDLCRAGVIVRTLTSFGRPNAIRVTIGSAQHNQRVADAVKKVASL